MWIADGWNDYEVIDTSSGEKLERWGNYVLLRPDPQVIWTTPKAAPEWNKLNAHYHRSSRGGGEWEFFSLPEQWDIHYTLGQGHAGRSVYGDSASGDGSSSGAGIYGSSAVSGEPLQLTFHLKPFSFKHTGLFPEQAVNWEWMHTLITRAVSSGRNIRVLNLFAYTGGATCACAASGAHVTHVDASKGMTSWAKENATSSGVDPALTRWIVDDCRKFVEREIRRGNHYDAIIMDPPSYGRGPKGEIWKMEDNIYDLIGLCAEVLSDDALFFLINSYTTGLQSSVLTYMLSSVLVPEKGGHVESDEVGLPVTASNLVLPCGASGRWFNI